MVTEGIRLRPDVIVVDVGIPLVNGLDAARKINVQAPDIKFVFLTMRDDPNLAAAALELDPIGFVLKHSPVQELLKAIDRVLHGKSYLTPKLRAGDWLETKAKARQFSKEMPPRQRGIVQLLAEGRSIKEIAGLLGISEKTVKFHKHHIMKAFNLESSQKCSEAISTCSSRRIAGCDSPTVTFRIQRFPESARRHQHPPVREASVTDWGSTLPDRFLAARALWPTGCEAASGSRLFVKRLQRRSTCEENAFGWRSPAFRCVDLFDDGCGTSSGARARRQRRGRRRTGELALP